MKSIARWLKKRLSKPPGEVELVAETALPLPVSASAPKRRTTPVSSSETLIQSTEYQYRQNSWPITKSSSQLKLARDLQVCSESVTATMDTAHLPAEIILQILDYLLPKLSLRRALNLRTLCKALDQELLHRFFVEGDIDEYSDKINSADCLTCRRPIRPERSEKAINRTTLLRYLVGILANRHLQKWDMRLKIFAVLTKTCGQKDIRDAVQQAWKSKTVNDRILSEEAHEALTLVPSMENPHLEARVMAEVITTLFGIRKTWSTLGPHHEMCGSQRQLGNKNSQFWSLLIAIYLDNTQLVTKYLDLLRPTVLAVVPPRTHADLQWYSTGNVKEYIWIKTIAAGLTIAIRKGHASIARLLLTQSPGAHRHALADVTFFNGLSVLGTAFVTTSDPSVAFKAKRVAIETAEVILRHWLGHETGPNQRAAAEISLLAPALFSQAFKMLFEHDTVSKQHACVYMLCEAAVNGNFPRVKFILRYMSEESTAHKQSPVPRYPAWPAPSHLSKMYTTRGDWTDESGFSIDRLHNSANPYRMAAAQGHEAVMKELLENGHILKLYIPGWPPGVGSAVEDNINTLKRYRMRGQLPCHPVREAVNDVFIDRQRLPNSKTRNPPNVRILKMLLDSCSKQMCWGGEVIACAGLSKDPEALDLLVKHVNLWELFPEDERKPAPDGADEHGKFVKGAEARTIGERALQHALRQGRVKNVEVLLRHGVRLAEGTKYQQLVFADDEDFSEDDDLHRVLVGSGTVEVKSRIAYQKYFIPTPCTGSIAELRAIEEDDNNFKWNGGNKMRNIGVRTAHEELSWSK